MKTILACLIIVACISVLIMYAAISVAWKYDNPEDGDINDLPR